MTGNGAGHGGPARGAGHGGPARGPGQPAFASANTVSQTHGAYSPRVVDPLAAEIVAGQLASPSCPPHLKEDPGRWSYALDAWGRAEATVRLLRAWVGGRDVGDALSETSEALEETTHRKGGSTKKTTGRRTESALAALDRAERTAAARRNDLGLTPMAAARLKVDMTPKFDLALAIAALEEETSGR